MSILVKFKNSFYLLNMILFWGTIYLAVEQHVWYLIPGFILVSLCMSLCFKLEDMDAQVYKDWEAALNEDYTFLYREKANDPDACDILYWRHNETWQIYYSHEHYMKIYPKTN